MADGDLMHERLELGGRAQEPCLTSVEQCAAQCSNRNKKRIEKRGKETQVKGNNSTAWK